MAIIVHDSEFGSVATSGLSDTVSVSIAAGFNRRAFLIIAPHSTGGSPDIKSVQIDGVDMTEVSNVKLSVGSARMTSSVWFIDDADLPATTGNYTITGSGQGGPDGHLWSWIVVSGAEPTQDIATDDDENLQIGTSPNTNTITHDLPAEANGLHLSALVVHSAGGFSVGAGQTTIDNQDNGASDFRKLSSYKANLGATPGTDDAVYNLGTTHEDNIQWAVLLEPAPVVDLACDFDGSGVFTLDLQAGVHVEILFEGQMAFIPPEPILTTFGVDSDVIIDKDENYNINSSPISQSVEVPQGVGNGRVCFFMASVTNSGFGGTPPTITSATLDGVAMTELYSFNVTVSFDTAGHSIWFILDADLPATAGFFNIVTTTTGVDDSTQFHYLALSNVDQLQDFAADDDFTNHFGNAGDPSIVTNDRRFAASLQISSLLVFTNGGDSPASGQTDLGRISSPTNNFKKRAGHIDIVSAAPGTEAISWNLGTNQSSLHWALIVQPLQGEDVDFELNLVGAGTYANNLAVDTNLAASFAGAGTYANDLVVDIVLAATFPGLGALAIDAAIDTTLAATFPGAGEIVVDLARFRELALNFNGQGVFTLDLEVAVLMAVDFDGAGTFTADLSRFKELDLALDGVGVFTVDAVVDTTLALDLDGVGVWTVDAVVDTTLAADFDGQGVFTPGLVLNLVLAADFDGAGVFTADLSRGKVFAADFDGAGVFTVPLNILTNLTTTFTGAGTWAVDAVIDTTLALELDGTTVFTADGMTRQLVFAVDLDGATDFAPFLKVLTPLAVTFTGQGVFTAEASFDTNLSVVFNGSTGWVVVAGIDTNLAISFEGVTDFSALLESLGQVSLVVDFDGSTAFDNDLVIDTILAADFDGQGTWALELPVDTPLAATFAGAGTIEIVLAAQNEVILVVNFDGATVWVVDLEVDIDFSVAFEGSTVWVVDAAIDTNLATSFTGLGDFSALLEVLGEVSLVVDFDGSTVFDTNLVIDTTLSTTFDGVGVLVMPPLQIDTALAATFAGQGAIEFLLAIQGEVLLLLDFDGQGTFQGDVSIGIDLSATFTGQGVWLVDARIDTNFATSFDGQTTFEAEGMLRELVFAVDFEGVTDFLPDLNQLINFTTSFEGVGEFDGILATQNDKLLLLDGFDGAGTYANDLIVDTTLAASFTGQGTWAVSLGEEIILGLQFEGATAFKLNLQEGLPLVGPRIELAGGVLNSALLGAPVLDSVYHTAPLPLN